MKFTRLSYHHVLHTIGDPILEDGKAIQLLIQLPWQQILTSSVVWSPRAWNDSPCPRTSRRWWVRNQCPRTSRWWWVRNQCPRTSRWWWVRNQRRTSRRWWVRNLHKGQVDESLNELNMHSCSLKSQIHFHREGKICLIKCLCISCVLLHQIVQSNQIAVFCHMMHYITVLFHNNYPSYANSKNV